MRKFFLKTVKSLAVGAMAVIFVTVGIDAADHYGSFSQSIIGRVMFGESSKPCPSDMVFVSTSAGGFCIDKYEASPSGECPYHDVASQRNTQANLDFKECHAVSAVGAFPWRYISRSQAAIACAKAGKRLPSYEEWYLASLGTPDKASGWGEDDCQVNKNWSAQPGSAGSGKNCLSAAGAYDMIGNVWEWVVGEVVDGRMADRDMPKQGYITAIDIHGLPVETDNSRGDPNYNEDYLWIKDKGIRDVARGGYWDNRSEAGIYALYLVPPPSYAGTGIGFRCVK